MVNSIHYHDFVGLKNLEVKAAHESPDSIQMAAQQFESMFINMVLKSMREANASLNSDSSSNETQDFYQEMHDQQLSATLSANNGIGLAEVLIKQLSKNLGNDKL